MTWGSPTFVKHIFIGHELFRDEDDAEASHVRLPERIAHFVETSIRVTNGL